MYKQILVLVGIATLAFLCHDTVAAQPSIQQVEVCQRIGNIEGPGRVTCVNPIGDAHARRGQTIGEGTDFFILVRFRQLPVGNQRLKVFYESGGEYGSGETSASRELSFRNQSESWAYWFSAHYKKAGSWRVTLSLNSGNRSVRRVVTYCIACYRGPE